MSIVNQLVQKMNGTITVESTVGEGSSFTVTLPFAIDHDPPAAGPEKDASADLHGKRLLVVGVVHIELPVLAVLVKVKVTSVSTGVAASSAAMNVLPA